MDRDVFLKLHCASESPDKTESFHLGGKVLMPFSFGCCRH